MPQKWDGIGQHIAYFLHTNTDIVLITMLIGLQEVAVYSVYNYIATSLYAIVLTCSANYEAICGEMFSQKEIQKLSCFFDKIDLLVNSIASKIFSVAAGVMVPFVMIYTSGINDANYFRIGLAYIMIITQLMTCIRSMHYQLITASGHFKQTNRAAYIEAVINISLSIYLCLKIGIEGCVIATLVSVIYRYGYFVFYIRRNIIMRSVYKSLKRLVVTFTIFVLNLSIYKVMGIFIGLIDSMLKWVIVSCVYVVVASGITFLISLICYKEEVYDLMNKMLRKA